MELTKLTILEIHEGLKAKKFSCVELTQAFLDRIETIDKKVESFITVTKEGALEQAKKVDEKLAKGEEINVLEGVPISIKDVIATKGVKTTAASKILENYTAPYDAVVAKRLKEKGAILLGKTNCDAFAHGASGENSDFGVTKNPWDLSRVPGGSSSGPAAAVAANLSTIGLGTDTGGSVRCPANYCGVFGLKPSYGRVPRYGLLSMTSSTDTVGIMAHTAKDVAATLEVIAGADEKDPTSRKVEVPNYLESLEKFSLEGKKIGLPKEYFTEGIQPEVREKVDQAIKNLASLGAELVEVSLPHTKYAVAVYYIITPSEISSNLARYDGIKYGYSATKDESKASELKDLFDVYTKTRRYGLGDENKRRVMIGTYALSSGYFDAYYKKASAVRHLIANDFKEVFKEVDFLAAPVSPSVAFKIGEKVEDPLSLYLEDIFLSAVSLSGLPGISVPCGVATTPDDDKIKMPVGLQLIGKYFEEDVLLGAAHLYEKNFLKEKTFPSL